MKHLLPLSLLLLAGCEDAVSCSVACQKSGRVMQSYGPKACICVESCALEQRVADAATAQTEVATGLLMSCNQALAACVARAP